MRGYVFTGDREVRDIEKPTPHPGPGQVLIKEKSSTICGSDLHSYRASKSERAESTNVFTGHEAVGEVIQVGEGVHWPRVGDRVVAYQVRGCGNCRYCQNRQFKLCPYNLVTAPTDPTGIARRVSRDGSNASHYLATVGQILPLPDDFSYEEASVLACNFGTAWGALKAGVPFPGGTVAVWGLGPVGLNIVLMGKAMGLRILGIDISEARRRLAELLGAEVLNGSREDIVAVLTERTHGEGPDTVIDTTGVGAVHEKLVTAVRPKGTVVLVGLGHQTAVGPVPQIILKQLSIKGSWIYDVDDWLPMLDFVRRHQLDVMRTVERVVPIAEFPIWIKEADAANCGKIVFTWDD